MEKDRPKLLLHVCCIGCGAQVIKELESDFQITLFFYNPNIYPLAEYERRWKESARIAEKFGWPIETGEYDHAAWLKLAAARADDPEKGERCRLCYNYRLEKTGESAGLKHFPYFATTLSISPHKDAAMINRAGQEAGKKSGVKFLDRDFKKKDGFRRSVALSHELGLYRQAYCGCEYSQRNR